MNELAPHIVTAYDAEIRRLDSLLAEMGGHCETQLACAVRAVIERNADLARETAGRDIVIDALEREVEGLIVRLLALRQPVAIDLRHILAALKAAANLERAGDYAKNIAKRAISLASLPPLAATPSIEKLGGLARDLLHQSLDALTQRDALLAAEVWRRDRELDDLHASVMNEIFGCLSGERAHAEACSHLQFVAKNLERIGDLATNIAETVQFDATGRLTGEERPRGGE